MPSISAWSPRISAMNSVASGDDEDWGAANINAAIISDIFIVTIMGSRGFSRSMPHGGQSGWIAHHQASAAYLITESLRRRSMIGAAFITVTHCVTSEIAA